MHPHFETLTKNLSDTVFHAIEYTPAKQALIVFDEDSTLSRLLTAGYKAVLPKADFVPFNSITPDGIRQKIAGLNAGDLVVLVQSTSFRLNEFRFRLELFNRALAVIEHPHLGRMPETEHKIYIDALAYDANYYRSVGPALKHRIDKAVKIDVHCTQTTLHYDGPFEPVKMNIGDYSALKNTGGQFPIGEVFTEPKDLTGVNGEVEIFAFADRDFKVIFPETPIVLTITKGLITDAKNAPPAFQSILEQIENDEVLAVRELGFGMNRAMNRYRYLTDIGSYERMCGIHLSLGAKHTMYAKEGFPKRSSKYHVDVFADITSVVIDDETVFDGKEYRV